MGQIYNIYGGNIHCIKNNEVQWQCRSEAYMLVVWNTPVEYSTDVFLLHCPPIGYSK